VRRLLLDTNVAIWLLLGDRDRVSRSVVEALGDTTNDVALSAASVSEIAIKRSLGKVRLPDEWPGALQRLGFDPMPVTAVHTAAVEALPWHHRDPSTACSSLKPQSSAARWLLPTVASARTPSRLSGDPSHAQRTAHPDTSWPALIFAREVAIFRRSVNGLPSPGCCRRFGCELNQ
jgi:PIN domain nuclease of toxin-antitoxin system